MLSFLLLQILSCLSFFLFVVDPFWWRHFDDGSWVGHGRTDKTQCGLLFFFKFCLFCPFKNFWWIHFDDAIWWWQLGRTRQNCQNGKVWVFSVGHFPTCIKPSSNLDQTGYKIFGIKPSFWRYKNFPCTSNHSLQPWQTGYKIFGSCTKLLPAPNHLFDTTKCPACIKPSSNLD